MRQRSSTNGAAEPPQELQSWTLFATRRRYFGVGGKRKYDESKLPEFIEERQRWEAEHGRFPDGERCRAARAPSAELTDLSCGAPTAG